MDGCPHFVCNAGRAHQIETRERGVAAARNAGDRRVVDGGRLDVQAHPIDVRQDPSEAPRISAACMHPDREPERAHLVDRIG